MAEICRRREVGYSTRAAWRRAAREDAVPRFVEIEAAVPEPGARRGPAGGGSGEILPVAGALLAELMLPDRAVLRVFEGAGTAAMEGGGS